MSSSRVTIFRKGVRRWTGDGKVRLCNIGPKAFVLELMHLLERHYNDRFIVLLDEHLANFGGHI